MIFMRKLLLRNHATGSDVFHVARHALRPRHLVPLHTHDFAEVFWVDAGACTHEINGTRVPLTSGELVMIRPSDAHRFCAVSRQGCTVVNVAFPAKTITHLKRRYFSKQQDFFQ